jgi:heat shock protein HslJ
MTFSLDGTWVVTSYLSEGSLVPPLPGSRPTVTFDGDTVAGTMGVNRFTGRHQQGSIDEALAVTRRAGPPERMEQEGTLLHHLVEADSLEVADDGMTLWRDALKTMVLHRSGTNRADGSSE